MRFPVIVRGPQAYMLDGRNVQWVSDGTKRLNGLSGLGALSVTSPVVSWAVAGAAVLAAVGAGVWLSKKSRRRRRRR